MAAAMSAGMATRRNGGFSSLRGLSSPGTRVEIRRGHPLPGAPPLGRPPVARVGDPRDAADLVGDLLGQRLLVVDAEDPGTDRGKRVGCLTADALPGSDDHEAAAVETEESWIVRDG